jgi:hypothetical protein
MYTILHKKGFKKTFSHAVKIYSKENRDTLAPLRGDSTSVGVGPQAHLAGVSNGIFLSQYLVM